MTCNCSTCYRASCDRRRPAGFGLTIPGITDMIQGEKSVSSGIVSTITGTALDFVPGGNLISSLISTVGSLIGVAPRGDLQKFKRNAYPYMRTMAYQSGLPTYIQWFGEVVQVNPDGSYRVIYGKGTPGMDRYEQMLIRDGFAPFYAVTCDPMVDCVNSPSRMGFQLFDPYEEVSGQADTVPYGATTPAGGTTGGSIPSGGTYTPPGTIYPGGGTYSAMGVDLKSLLLWGGLAGAAYMLFSERKRRG